MEILKVDSLMGVTPEIQPEIYAAMETCSNAQRLCVCLYLMSDLPDFRHSLDFIEENLSEIFPPSIPHGNTPDSYKDFAATAIRQYFNYETSAVKQGEFRVEERLWTNPERGYWRNTDVGNSYALRTLMERGIAIQKGGVIQEPSTLFVDYGKRRYLDENKASEALDERRKLPTTDSLYTGIGNTTSAESSNSDLSTNSLGSSKLLNKLKNLLNELSNTQISAPIVHDSMKLHIAGSPKLIWQLLQGDSVPTIVILDFHLFVKDGIWQVELVVAA